MRRDFSFEHPLNVFFRVKRACLGRLRANTLRLVGLFGSMGKGSFIGSGARFINPKLVLLGEGVCFGVGARIECFGSAKLDRRAILQIGPGTTFGDYVHIGCTNSVEIGRNVLFGSHILIIDHSHGKPSKDILLPDLVAPNTREVISKGGIVVGDNVWVADGVVILAGAKIGEGAIIGTGAVVRGSIDARTIFLG